MATRTRSPRSAAPVPPLPRGASVLGPRKTVEEALASTEEESFRLRRVVGALDVTVLGVGVIVGAGIFVLTGVAAATEAGPAVTLSFVAAAAVCALAALCYAEFASMVPVAGSAYTFSYVTLGQLVAFVIGWDLALEFTVGAAAVAIGWSGYLSSTLEQVFGVALPAAITAPPGEGGVVNVFAILVVAALVGLLVVGIRMTAKANLVLVAITIAVLLLVIGAGATAVDPGNWTPFLPFGTIGILGGAALVFFAFIGFDIVATAAEETRNPQRDMPIGILASLGITAALYVAVAAVVTGMVAYTALGSEAPLADAFEALEMPWVAGLVYAGALVALTNTVLILLLGQSRVAFAMARDRLLPRWLGRTHPRFGTPWRITLVTGVVVAVLAGFTPITVVAELVNIGTLFAFALVAAGVWLLRRTEPDRPRPFRTPLVPWVPLATIVGCGFLMATLEPLTWVRFGLWMALGVLVYLAYGRRRATAARERHGTGA